MRSLWEASNFLLTSNTVGVRLGYVIGLRCVCGSFSHNLMSGYILCLSCSKKTPFNILEGDDDNGSSNDKQ